MTEGQTNGAGGSLGLGVVLFIVFLILKLTHVIDWSWWWIFAPLWIPFCLFILFAIAMLIFIFISDRE